jgi:uncharacterized membrane protein
MIGFVVGAVVLFGLFKLARHHHACAHGGRGWRVPWSRRSGGRRGGPWARAPWSRVEHVLNALRVTPDQEIAIRDHVREFKKRVEPLSAEAHRTREDLSTALRADSFDETRMGEMFARHDDALRDARREVVGLLAHVHAVLDDDQRRVLARMVESGRGAPFGGDPYRAAHL